jgi:hypothetical protein
MAELFIHGLPNWNSRAEMVIVLLALEKVSSHFWKAY